MSRKNRRDPFAGVPAPSARHPRAAVLRAVAGRMRNIIIEKHAPAAAAAGRPGELDSLLDALTAILARPFDTHEAAAARRGELIAVLIEHGERYGRWAERLGEG